MATSILLKFLTLKWNISRTTGRIEVGDGSSFCILHALSFGLNFFFDRRFPLTSDASSLRKIFSICAMFQSYSSLKLNLEKSEACWIGVKQGCSEKLVDCEWIDIKTGAIHAFGVFNSYDTDLVEKLNFLDNLKALADVCNLWQYRDFLSQEKF